MSRIIYKICSKDMWDRACEKGVLTDIPDDLRDGFIHFSAPDQVRETARKHFRNQDSLVLVEVDAKLLGEKLKWEISRNGELFPHLYDVLDVNLVTRVYELPVGSNEEHVFPAEVPL